MDWLWDTLGALAVVIILSFWTMESVGFKEKDYKVFLYVLVIVGIILIAIFALALFGVL